MGEQELASKARKHWAKWLPAKVAELKASGQFEEAVQAAAKLAAARISELQEMGYQPHEAEEVALPEYILLKPEADAESPDWETKELAELEREYRRMMRNST